jgi:hypothetical protein
MLIYIFTWHWISLFGHYQYRFLNRKQIYIYENIENIFLIYRYRYLSTVVNLIVRVSTEVTFRNSAEYGILCGSDFNSAEFLGNSECLIPWISPKFRAFLYTEFHIYFLSVIIFFVNSVLYFKVVINCTLTSKLNYQPRMEQA